MSAPPARRRAGSFCGSVLGASAPPADAAADAADAAARPKPTTMPALVKIDGVPAWMRKDDLLTGYRPLLQSYELCLGSVFALHNQTLNIYSALCCIAWNAALGAMQWRQWQSIDAALIDAGFGAAPDAGVPFGQWVGAGAVPGSVYGWLLAHIVLRMLCWVASAGWHTLEAHSPAVAELWCTLDFLGIYTSFIGMGGNAINALCLATCAAPATRAALLGWGTLASCAAIGCSFTEWFRRDARVSGGVFGVVMASYVLPIAALGWGLPGSPLRFLVWSCTSAALGGACYLTRVPERFVKHRWLDVGAPSHSLWHWGNVPHDFFVLSFTWALSQLALRQGFACPAPAGAHPIAGPIADALGAWWY